MSEKYPPKEPSHSCPSFDQAISYIEEARNLNYKLREWGTWWQETAEELESGLDEREAQYEKGLKDAQSDLADAQEEVVELKDRIEELENEIEVLRQKLYTTGSVSCAQNMLSCG